MWISHDFLFVKNNNMWSLKDHELKTKFYLSPLVSTGPCDPCGALWSLISLGSCRSSHISSIWLTCGGSVEDLYSPGPPALRLSLGPQISQSWSLVTVLPAPPPPHPGSLLGNADPLWGSGLPPVCSGNWCTWGRGGGSRSCWVSCQGGMWGWDAAARQTLH